MVQCAVLKIQSRSQTKYVTKVDSDGQYMVSLGGL